MNILPPEIVHHIITLCDPLTWRNCLLVCRRWSKLTTECEGYNKWREYSRLSYVDVFTNTMPMNMQAHWMYVHRSKPMIPRLAAPCIVSLSKHFKNEQYLITVHTQGVIHFWRDRRAYLLQLSIPVCFSPIQKCVRVFCTCPDTRNILASVDVVMKDCGKIVASRVKERPWPMKPFLLGSFGDYGHPYTMSEC
jgi:hypothetical protein